MGHNINNPKSICVAGYFAFKAFENSYCHSTSIRYLTDVRYTKRIIKLKIIHIAKIILERQPRFRKKKNEF